MGLNAALSSAALSMQALERCFEVIENNVTNASTPGYAKQTQVLAARRFSTEQALSGGVAAGAVLSSRSRYAEQSVWRQMKAYGLASQRVSDLAQLEPVLTIAENTGIAGALSDFYGSSSSLSVNPNDVSSRQVVLERAAALARSFNATLSDLAGASLAAEREVANVVARINVLTGRVTELNEQRRSDFRNAQDAGLDAQLYAVLEDLSELGDFNVIDQPDGSVSVFLNGQEPLVIGDRQFEISVGINNNQIELYDSEGNNLAAQTREGRLGALIDLRNNLTPSLTADLNTLAQAFADRVNGLLAGGVDLNGQTPVKNLFTYDPVAGAANSLAITGITPEEIAAALPGAQGGNGNALQIAALSSSKEIGGYTFTEYYGEIAATVGRQLANAQDNLSSQESLLAQARSLRQEESGVSLDEQAALLMQMQRNYEAVGKLLSVLDELTNIAIGMIR
jgi:flagellar hook-associated protein 1 FlgK